MYNNVGGFFNTANCELQVDTDGQQRRGGGEKKRRNKCGSARVCRAEIDHSPLFDASLCVHARALSVQAKLLLYYCTRQVSCNGNHGKRVKVIK